MQINLRETRQYLRESEFETLFIEELGWDYHRTQPLNITVDETEYQLTAIAEKRGMAVFECSQTTTDDHIPDYPTRRKIQKEVAKSFHENLIIYTDVEKNTQIWQWVRREHGKPTACREHWYHTTQPGDLLIQKLETIAFSFEEEGQLTLFDVTSRVRSSFDIERVTKKFYDHFKREHTTFLKFLNGIPDEEKQRWYASVMLNRLMFIYFIQKKRFLDNDPDYLGTKLAQGQEQETDQYYKKFLCPLFFEGFAKPEVERSREVKRLIGKIPYLNGGIFQKHQIETLHGENIEIPDIAFEKLFNFFESYEWHLDDRPLRSDNEINPDVLGYIFEKYINQKQMGAYYTKEDITDYISKNTIIPCLFDKAQRAYKTAFEANASVWQLLQNDPDRYIYGAVKKGADMDLPEEIAAGIGDISKRPDCWNTLASDEYALPTEIWREVVARRQRYETVRAKLANGEIHDINDLITYNLNIRQFAQDVIENCEGPELLRAFWRAITEVTILDPTCGSGAFLFAALNILEPLYEVCLDRMQVFLDEVEMISESQQSRKYSDFRNILEDIEQHPNRCYFILKSIIINNLYGVDIMEEAIEICKLRLFLKMVAQLEDVSRIEPLPDIDFNVQAGNTLIGYTTYDEVKKAVTGKLDFDDTMKRIEEKVEDIEWLSFLFRQQQTELGGAVTFIDKQALQDKLQVLEEELNLYLAGEHGTDTSRMLSGGGGGGAESGIDSAYQTWLSSHKPLHWFIAFYGILKNGGFDVIIGNPPYVESKGISGYETKSCGNLYAFITERSLRLLNNNSSFGFIVPLSLVCTQRMETLQKILSQSSKSVWLSNFAERPSKLFVGAEVLLTILLSRVGREKASTFATTEFTKWTSDERADLFDRIVYHSDVAKIKSHIIPKLRSDTESRILAKLFFHTGPLGNHLLKRSKALIYYRTSGGRYWKVFTDFPPAFKVNGKSGQSKAEKSLGVGTPDILQSIIAALSSNLFFWWYTITTDCRNLPASAIQDFPIPRSVLHDPQLIELGKRYLEDLRHNSTMEVSQKSTGLTETQSFKIQKSKPIIDEIDRVLAKHYGFTDEELDFIINYDIKYRMGLGN